MRTPILTERMNDLDRLAAALAPFQGQFRELTSRLTADNWNTNRRVVNFFVQSRTRNPSAGLESFNEFEYVLSRLGDPTTAPVGPAAILLTGPDHTGRSVVGRTLSRRAPTSLERATMEGLRTLHSIAAGSVVFDEVGEPFRAAATLRKAGFTRIFVLRPIESLNA
jgi:hypothetical protein